MYDFDRDATRSAAHPAVDEAAAAQRELAAPGRPTAEHLDAASVMHLQRTAGNASVVQLLAEEGAEQPDGSSVHEVIGKGGGQPLDAGTRTAMESSFGQDFSDVRVHTDSKASASAESVGANAYTVGNEIVFRGGHFDSSSPTGQRTIAHELSHVVQQRSGPVDGTDAPGGIRLSDPSDRFERAADSTAEQVMAGRPVSGQEAAAASAGTPVQLQADDEEQNEETMQRLAIQREEQPEEEIQE